MVGDGVKSIFFKACRWFGGSIWLNEVLSLPLDAFSPTSTHTPFWLEVRSGGRRLVRLRAQALGSARIRLCPPYAVRHTDKALPFLEPQFQVHLSTTWKLYSGLFSRVGLLLLSCVQLFATPWTAALQAPLSFTISLSLLKLMSIESVMSSKHLILCHPLLLLPSVFPSTRVIPMS